MAFDAHKNFAISQIITAPSPRDTGTSLVVKSGEGGRFPAVSFNAVAFPPGQSPESPFAEVVRVTAISTDTFTITRAQESSTARAIDVGWYIVAGITVKTITDLETRAPLLGLARNAGGTLGVAWTTYATLTATSKGGRCVARVGAMVGNGNSGANRSFNLRVTCDGSAITPAAITPVFSLFVSGSTTYETAMWAFDSTPSAASHTWNLQLQASVASAVVLIDNFIEVSEVTGA